MDAAQFPSRQAARQPAGTAAALPLLSASRLAERQSTDPAVVQAVLSAGLIAHLGLLRDGWPVVLPFHYGVGDLGDGRGQVMIVHGSTGGGVFLQAVSAGTTAGVPVSVCVTLNDGLVVGRSLCNLGAHYRSVIAFGWAQLVPAELKQRALDILVDHILPGRRGEVPFASAKELAATALLAIDMDHVSAKVADSKNGDSPGEDEDRSIWAGVVPLVTATGQPVAAPMCAHPADLPASVQSLLARFGGSA